MTRRVARVVRLYYSAAAFLPHAVLSATARRKRTHRESYWC
ncbi:hypothetical protein BURKHO8Y_150110 [Burkholderia sp. 8Y]|nr:hypothetical protein BURKHO8Y_150110 [Burkholderia sp. 8Y]